MKHLVILFDGTWNHLGMSFPTNVARVGMALEATARDGNPQVAHYVTGLGTGRGMDKFTGGGLGHGIDQKILDGYTFLVNNYEPGDAVYVFGFSRGAYTARSLTGLLSACGLPKRQYAGQVPAAYEAYRNRTEPKSKKFMRAFGGNLNERSHGSIPITFLGCWDTVASLGVPDRWEALPIDRWINEKYAFHENNEVSKYVQYAAHAVALDERREEFDIELMKPNRARTREANQRADDPAYVAQEVTEVWFPGDHGSVGGGTWYKRGLSNLTLRWMLKEMVRDKHALPLEFDLDRVTDSGPNGRVFTTRIDPLIFVDNEVKSPYEEFERGRKVPRGAVFHPSVASRKRLFGEHYVLPDDANARVARDVAANVGDMSKRIVVYAPDKQNDTGIDVEKGRRYRVRIADTQVWKDGNLEPCGVGGWMTDDIDDDSGSWWNPIPAFKEAIVSLGEKARQLEEEPWFSLVLYTEDHAYAVKTAEAHFTAEQSGRLYACPNDTGMTFGNNRGWLVVTIEPA